jgi:hypothetical protein
VTTTAADGAGEALGEEESRYVEAAAAIVGPRRLAAGPATTTR